MDAAGTRGGLPFASKAVDGARRYFAAISSLLLPRKLHTVPLKRQHLLFLLPSFFLDALIIHFVLPQLIKVAECIQVRLLVTVFVSSIDMDDPSLDQVLYCGIDRCFTDTAAFCDRCFAREAAAFFIVALLQKTIDHERIRAEFVIEDVIGDTEEMSVHKFSQCIFLLQSNKSNPDKETEREVWTLRSLLLPLLFACPVDFVSAGYQTDVRLSMTHLRMCFLGENTLRYD